MWLPEDDDGTEEADKPKTSGKNKNNNNNNNDGGRRLSTVTTRFGEIRGTADNSSCSSCRSGSSSCSSASSDDDHHTFMGEDQRTELVRIATALTRTVASPGTRQSSVLYPVDYEPELDPAHDAFDLSAWLRRFIDQLQNQGITYRRTGVAFRNLDVFGSGSALQLQSTVGSVLTAPLRLPQLLRSGRRREPRHILHGFEGVVRSGELLIVLGRPGSGCSTLLRTLTGELHGLALGSESRVHYNGIPLKTMRREFRGEIIYNQEVDKHFPHLTVGQTLEFAAAARTPSSRIQGMSRNQLSKHIAKVVMTVFGLSHTYNTKVGGDFVRGVSGGERKRVSIAEMVVAGSPLASWDNSTRGLDSATAFTFVQSLRLTCDLACQTNLVAIYQASQAIYDLFDKVTVLYEGRQIFFGPADRGRQFFEEQGWYCPPRQTTGDFLTSVTNPSERRARTGMEDRVPRTPEEFEAYWRSSTDHDALIRELDEYEGVFLDAHRPEETMAEFRQQTEAMRARHRVRKHSPYIISIWLQLGLNVKRAYQRIRGDMSAKVAQTMADIFMALIIGSLFYNTPDATVGFYPKGAVLFMAVLMNALTAISEISGLYEQRPVVEKQRSYAFYHPATEALAGLVADIPIKFVTSVCFNLIVYFLANLHRSAGQFFLYYLVIFVTIFVMSAIFRTLAAATKTISQAMALAGIMALALIQYTGFAIRIPQMHPWLSWIRWINPVFYAFEILIANEFHGHRYTCSSIIPNYSPPVGDSWICASPGAVAGQDTVSGDSFIKADYEYTWSHAWRNFGILCGFLVGFIIIYLFTIEVNSSTTSTAESLVFPRSKVPPHLKQGGKTTEKGPVAERSEDDDDDKEGGEEGAVLQPQTDLFTWRRVVYDIEIKGQERRLLNHVDGWVKPGTLTALMGVSGAGKTTLLDVLAHRTTMGVVTGDMLVNGKPLDSSFQRKTGYVQQQDVHLATATVRESLRFSAMVRQPNTVSRKEKYASVEEVIKMLNMQEFANAVVGVPGEGLNVEQRKLLTIGVELAAKPKLLLFLDEPTSGLDSQSSWAICCLLRKLADAGQAILCTVHQPSAILFQSFDRLLFLARGGMTVYFGDIGENSRTLLDYFEGHGARVCGEAENPAEFMLEVVNKGHNEDGTDWHTVWKSSREFQNVQEELDKMQAESNSNNNNNNNTVDDNNNDSHDHRELAEFAVPLPLQFVEVFWRLLQQYWRMPSYIFAKFLLGAIAGLFVGFTFFHAQKTMAGVQDVIYAVFMLLTVFTTLVQQMHPLFVTQRALYEVRERPSKTYSWKAFITANILVEIPFQVFTGIIIFGSFYYPIMGVQSPSRQGLVLLFVLQLLVYSAAFADMTIVSMPDAHTAGSLATVLVLMSILFCGVLQSPTAMPGFWIFMYRLSPFTYWVAGIIATELHDQPIGCTRSEESIFPPPPGMSCGQYLEPFFRGGAQGRLADPDSLSECRYCAFSSADQVLAGSWIYWDQRWRNYGIGWAYIVFDILVAVMLYYLFRLNSISSLVKKLIPKRLGKSAKALKKTISGKEKEEKEAAAT
ncbi:hypothetical protein CP532_5866 [Ophiocordyceps camponoti-leonardi (nom. inval.)]|nr:hypothetical protein CP532_5866 [Ophiocordyceps camponoti-leonardi (nom. inval.)]